MGAAIREKISTFCCLSGMATSTEQGAQPQKKLELDYPRTANAARYPFHSGAEGEVAELAHFSREAEFRSPNVAERAACLVSAGLCSQRTAAVVLNISHRRVEHAVQAKREMRPIGRFGRPPLLTEEQEEELLEAARESYLRGHPMKFSDLQDKVCSSLL